jgi:hypothetical protein
MTTPKPPRTPSKKLGADTPDARKAVRLEAVSILCKAVVRVIADNPNLTSVRQAAVLLVQEENFKHLKPQSVESEFATYATEEQKQTVKIHLMARPTKTGRIINAMRKLGALGCVQSIPEASKTLARLGYYFKEDGEHAIKAGTVKVYWAWHTDEDDQKEAGFVKRRRSSNPELPENDVLMVNLLIKRAGKNATLEDLAIAFNCTEEQLVAHLQGTFIPHYMKDVDLGDLDDIAAE